jgi:hypothetical protein
MNEKPIKNKATFRFMSMKAEAEGIYAVKVTAAICFCGMLTTIILATLALTIR